MPEENIELDKLTKEIKGDSDDDTRYLIQMREDAVKYIQGYKWCPQIKNVYFGMGIGKIVAVFLMEFSDPLNGIDKHLWVVNGDLPSAYLVIDNAPNPELALDGYCELMEDWIQAIVSGSSLKEVFPVNAPADKEHAEMLRTKISFIRKDILGNPETK